VLFCPSEGSMPRDFLRAPFLNNIFDCRMASILTGMAEECAICGLMPLLSLDLLLLCVFVDCKIH